MSDKGIDKIISHIQAETEKEIEEVLSKAREEADRIKNASLEKAEQEAENILAKGKRAAILEGQRIMAETKIQVRRRKMDAQEEVIAASFSEAAKALEDLAEKGKRDTFVYRDVLFNLVVSACDIIPGNKVELAFNQRDAKAFDANTMGALQGLVKEKTGRAISLALSDKSIQCLGGVVVRDAERNIEVNNTLEAKLNRLKGSIRVDVAKILFGDKL